MGLFKKKSKEIASKDKHLLGLTNSKDNKPEDDDIESHFISTFKNQTEQKEVNENIDNTPIIHSPDSPEAEVFITYKDTSLVCWKCSECGCVNDMSMDGCVVCGKKRE